MEPVNISLPDLAVELADKINVPKADATEAVKNWKVKAKAHIKAKGYLVVDEDSGNAVKLEDVIAALSPDEDDIEQMMDDEAGDNADYEDKDENEETESIGKAIADAIESAAKNAHNYTDNRLKALQRASVKVGDERNDDEGTASFKHFGEFSKAVMTKAKTGVLDKRLLGTKDATTFGNANVGADGGFLIPPDFRAEILKYALAQPTIWSRCRQFQTSSNHLEIPIDKTTPWSTDGTQVEWFDADDADSMTQRKPKLGKTTVNLHDLGVLVPVTNNMLEDSAVAVDAYLREAVAPRINYAIDDAVLNGDGNGKPMGIRNSGAIVSVTRNATNGANLADLVNLIQSVGDFNVSPSVAYVAHRTLIADIFTATIGDNGVFLQDGTGEGADALLQRVLTKPILYHQAAQTRDAAGDLGLYDFAQYILLTKTGDTGMRTDVSMHLYFDQNTTAFRFVMRVGGQPWTNAVVDDDNGSGDFSPFAQLAAAA